MKTLISRCFFLFAIYPGLAQTMEVKTGPVYTGKNMPEGGIHFLSTSLRKAYEFNGMEVRVLDDYLKYNGTKKLTVEFEPTNEKLGVQVFFEIKGKNFIIYSIARKERKEHALYVNEVSPEMVLLGSPLLLHIFKEFETDENILVIPSYNNKHYLLARVFLRNKIQMVDCKVVTPEFSEVWSRTFDIGKNDKAVSLNTLRIDDEGNFFGLGYLDARLQQKPFLISFYWKKQHENLLPLGDDENENFGYKLLVLNGKNPVIGGLYSKGKIIGYSLFRVSDSGKTEPIASNPIGEAYKKLINAGYYEKKFFAVSDLKQLTNSDYAIDIEGNLFVGTGTGSNGSFLSSPILLVSVSTGGLEKWNRIIYKTQARGGGAAQDLLGHRLFQSRNKLFVVYNDDRDNADAPPEKKVGGYDGLNTMVVVQEIDENGHAKKYDMLPGKQWFEFRFLVNQTQKISDNEFLVSFMRVKPTTVSYATIFFPGN